MINLSLLNLTLRLRDYYVPKSKAQSDLIDWILEQLQNCDEGLEKSEVSTTQNDFNNSTDALASLDLYPPVSNVCTAELSAIQGTWCAGPFVLSWYILLREPIFIDELMYAINVPG